MLLNDFVKIMKNPVIIHVYSRMQPIRRFFLGSTYRIMASIAVDPLELVLLLVAGAASNPNHSKSRPRVAYPQIYCARQKDGLLPRM